MEEDGQFADFDEESTFKNCLGRAVLASTRNFVVEFGEESAEIAFDFQAGGIKTLLNSSSPVERPVRWMCVSLLFTIIKILTYL